MNFQLTEQQEMLRAVAREFANGEIAPIARQIDASEEIPDSLRKKLRDANFFGLLIPEKYGGADGGAGEYVLVMGELSPASPAVAITISVHNSVGAGAIARLGAQGPKSCLLPAPLKEKLAAVATTA